MTENTPSKTISFRDKEMLQKPYEAYSFLQTNAPVYFDEASNFYVISRYDDIRKLAADRTALNSHGAGARLMGSHDPAREARIAKLFEEKGWFRANAMGHYDGEDYRERRDLFERFLRGGKVREYDGLVQEIAYDLARKLAAKPELEADVVSEYCELLSVRVICRILGAPDDVVPIIKGATDAMIASIGRIGATEEEDVEATLKMIAGQHFIKGMIDEKRARPDDTILSEFVNAPLLNGETMTVPEILTLVMTDLFFAGAETAARALGSGVYYLCKTPGLQARLRADLDGNLRGFVEEVLRLEPPAGSLARIALRDITLHGVTIPKGSLVMLSAAAGNRDAERFACPANLEVERDNAASHLTFGSGAHSCVGAPLARRELFLGFKALLETLGDIRLAGDSEPKWGSHRMRGFEELRIRYRPL